MSLHKKDRIYVSGHTGMVGSAIVRMLQMKGFRNLILTDREELDLLDSNAVKQFFFACRPDIVILAAAKVGGIQANISSPVEFLLNNLTIQNNVISHSYLHGVRELLFFGSSCIYPKNCSQPMKEEHLLHGELEPTNEGYALAKISGLKLLEYYHKQYGFNSISLIPCNLYGTNDSFNPEHAHVLSSLVKKFVDAKCDKLGQVEIWGTGVAKREFMHVDDLAAAALYFMENYNHSPLINIGWGEEVSIKQLVNLIQTEVSFEGEIIWNSSKPDGMLRKCMDVSKMRNAGFKPEIVLKDGIRRTISEYENLTRML
ncbi:GDP-L-fucose synthase family protein [Pedobacter sp. AW31-3R]|uniref:GDP-L-fucose synthase family protein n=1 Tax=Pedobacter sp. AW31-3R TaxID=3445781 RepID=UPI003FA0A587